MNAQEKWMGKIVSFASVPGDQFSERYYGEVIGVRGLGTQGPGNPSGIPDYAITVKGRTGQTKEITILNHYISFYESWAEALQDTLQK